MSIATVTAPALLPSSRDGRRRFCVGVAHWNVRTRIPGEETGIEMDGILLITFAPDGRCRDHREWYAKRDLPAR